MFGLEIEESEHYNAVIFFVLFLYLKFYIHRCKLQNNSPSFQAYKHLIKIKIKSEYKIAESKGKLSKHLKTCNFYFGLGNSLLCLSCVLWMGWVGGRMVGLGFVFYFLGMVLGIIFFFKIFDHEIPPLCLSYGFKLCFFYLFKKTKSCFL